MTQLFSIYVSNLGLIHVSIFTPTVVSFYVAAQPLFSVLNYVQSPFPTVKVFIMPGTLKFKTLQESHSDFVL